MSLILNIFTALETASVCLANNGKSIAIAFSNNQKDHAGWIHNAISQLLTDNNYSIKQINAVAVSIGPGSYTGLRIGLATAKGLCYALNIPLISVDTLSIIAYAVQNEATDYICPLIDARRMEVFMSLFDKDLNQLMAPATKIIDENSFSNNLSDHRILFCGDGSKKLQKCITNPNAVYSDTVVDASHLSYLSFMKFQQKGFSNLAYIEPFYIKDFFSSSHKE